MYTTAKLQKWGNSSAIRLSTKVLAAAGLSPGVDVDIEAGDGRLIITLHQKTDRQTFEKLLEHPDANAKEIFALLTAKLRETNALTEQSNNKLDELITRIDDGHKPS